MSTPSTAPHPPALSRRTPRSFEADDPAALKAALLAQGARELPAPSANPGAWTMPAAC